MGGLGWTGLSGLGWAGLAGRGWGGLDWGGLGWTGLSWLGGLGWGGLGWDWLGWAWPGWAGWEHLDKIVDGRLQPNSKFRESRSFRLHEIDLTLTKSAACAQK